MGRVETGKLKVGQKVVFVPGREGKGVEGEVKSIEMHHEQVQEAILGITLVSTLEELVKKILHVEMCLVKQVTHQLLQMSSQQG